LTISSLTQSPPSQQVGLYATYTFAVSNQGQATASNVWVNWIANWNNGTPRDITQIKDMSADHGFVCVAPLSDYEGQEVQCAANSLAASETAHITFSVLGSSVPTTATVTVTADPDLQIKESNENNNQATTLTTFTP
jgi:subtilase family serine protease